MTQEATETTVPEILMEDQPPLESFATIRQESGWSSRSRFSAREEETVSQTTRTAEKQPETEVSKDDLLFQMFHRFLEGQTELQAALREQAVRTTAQSGLSFTQKLPFFNGRPNENINV